MPSSAPLYRGPVSPGKRNFRAVSRTGRPGRRVSRSRPGQAGRNPPAGRCTMRYMMMVRMDESMPAGPPPPSLFAAIGELGEQARKDGALLEEGGLLPSAAE